jgi:hypothetical protein
MPTPKHQVGELPSPAWTYALLAGADPGCRLPGWPRLYQQHVGESDAAAVWARHRAALCELASQHEFQPFRLHKRLPMGDGFARWQEQFLAQHRY